MNLKFWRKPNDDDNDDMRVCHCVGCSERDKVIAESKETENILRSNIGKLLRDQQEHLKLIYVLTHPPSYIPHNDPPPFDSSKGARIYYPEFGKKAA